MSDDRVKVAGVWMSREEARIAKDLRRHLTDTGSARRRRWTMIGGLGSAFVLSRLAAYASIRSPAPWRAVWSAISVVFIAACFHIVLRYRGQRQIELRRAINRLGRRVCVKCAYEIANDSPYGEVCPECGTPFKEPANHA